MNNIFIVSLIAFSFSALSYAQEVATTYYTIKKGDTIYNLAQEYDLGFDEILAANPDITDPTKIYVGSQIILPLMNLLPDVKHEGIVINLAELRLYFFEGEENVISFPISIGAEEKTPLGKTKIANKTENPSWIPPLSIREENPKLPEIVPPGPENPLGNYALYLDASKNSKWQSIMIHGTNQPTSIGARVSHGCIRLFPWDIEKLFNLIEIDTPVTIINQPIKIADIDGKAYLESHFREGMDVVFESSGISKMICAKIKNCETRIDWKKVDDVVAQNLGIPVKIEKDLAKN